jgi:hypothetical protein
MASPTGAPASRARRVLLVVLAVLTPLLLLTATVSTWAHFEVLAPDALGRHTRNSLQQPAVRSELATQITRRVAAEDPRLAAAAPVVRRAAEILISSREAADLVEIALQQVRRAVLEGRDVEGTRLSDLETQLRDTLAVVDPSIAAQVPRNWDTGVIDLSTDAPLPRALRAAEVAGRLWWLLAASATASAVGLVIVAYQRRRALGYVGASFGAVGAAVLLGRRIAADQVSGNVRGERGAAAVRAVFDVTTNALHEIGLGFLLVAAVVLVATLGGSVVPIAAGSIARRVAALARVPSSPARRMSWAAAALVAGIALTVFAPRIGPAVAVLAGVGLGFAGVWVLAQALPSTVAPRTLVPRRPVLALASVVVVLTSVVVVVRTGDDDEDPPRAEPSDVLVCNGHAELCDRRLDEVVFAGTHNSMASAESGFLFAEQTGSLSAQLDAGIRLLLVDTYYGIPTASGLVLTDLVFNSRAALVSRYGEQTVIDIENLRNTVVQPSAPSSVYLCHSFCELGAVPASAAFAEIRTFLARRPSEVVVLMVQDETERADTVRAFESAGLADLAHAQDPDEPWPTLGELVRAGTPLVVFAQRSGGEPPWFHDSFAHVQDNPYSARSIADLSCARNRGSLGAELFLVNHWINRQPPDVADARAVNQRDFLLDQIRRCEEEREQRVNFVAVDFWQSGSLLGVVDELNVGDNDNDDGDDDQGASGE